MIMTTLKIPKFRSAERALEFAYKHKVIDENIEKLIAQDSDLSFRYAKHVLNGRFELGEPSIAKNPLSSLYYAQYVLEDRFYLAENLIVESKDGKKQSLL